jgi:Fic family protein
MFTLDLTGLDHRTWLLLGEADAMCRHIAGAPLRPDVAQRLHTIYLSRGIHATTSIEGNTLTEDEVLRRVQGDLELPPSRAYLGREIDNVVEGCNVIVDDVVQGRSLELTRERIEFFNGLILRDLPVGDEVVPGVVREHGVGVARYLGAPAEDCEYLLDRMCEWLNGMGVPPGHPELTFSVAVLKAVMAHLYLAWIHPFGDGNGRTARLVEFQLLVGAGIPLPAAHLLSDHYNRTREAYYAELGRTSRRGCGGGYLVEGFVHYAMQGFVDELQEQNAEIRAQQLDVTWRNYVHERFRDHATPARSRQRRLALDLPAEAVVPVSRVPEVSVRLARAYAGKTAKTVTRDINALVTLGLVTRVRGGIRADRDVISAFLPLRRESDRD